MDPNVTLENIRAAYVALIAHLDDKEHGKLTREQFESAADELAGQVQVLDEWLSKGGFRPLAWTLTTDHPDAN